MTRFRELCDEADRRGLRVRLEVIGRGKATRLICIRLVDLHGSQVDVCGIGISGLERAAAVLLARLARRLA